MNREYQSELAQTANALFSRRSEPGCAPPSGLDLELWNDLESLGFTTLTTPTELGGSGGDLLDAAVLVRAGSLAALPLAEALFLVGPLLTAAGLPVPAGPITASSSRELTLTALPGNRWALSGRVRGVPWLDQSLNLVCLVRHHDRDMVAVVARNQLEVARWQDLAGDSRDSAHLHAVSVSHLAQLPTGDWHRRFELLGATARANQIAAAGDVVLSLCLNYAGTRVQFGRKLTKFQAIQHHLARLASEVAIADAASTAAASTLASPDADTEFTVAVAKAETSGLVRSLASTSHQVHGAIGFTLEHSLGSATKRMWSWREEFGNEDYWRRQIADLMRARSIDAWSLLTGAPRL